MGWDSIIKAGGNMKQVPFWAIAVAVLLSGCGSSTPPPPVTVTVGSPMGQSSERAPEFSSAESASRPTMTAAPAPTGPQSVITTDGTYLVGTDIYPGMYRTGGGSQCYWARLNSLDTGDIIDNHNSSGPQVIEILPTDRAFLSQNCQTWTLQSGPVARPAATPTVAVPAAPEYPVS